MLLQTRDAKAIFADVLELPAEVRLAYLEAEYGSDESLRAEVADLLAAHESAGTWLGGTVDLPALAESTEVPQVTRVKSPSLGDPMVDLQGVLQLPQEPGSLGRLDHYEVLELIGRGGFGTVLKARDTKLRRIVAVKLLATHLAVNGDARKRFAREAQAAAAVRDEHVIGIHDVQDGTVPYLVMEFVSGETLADRLRTCGALNVRELLRIGIHVARGLAAAHARGLVHRDVKPANILLDIDRDRARLTDFGLARTVVGFPDGMQVTADGTIIGTPAYMSPEQARGKLVDARTDLFSLGVVLYQMATGELPFRGTDILSVLSSLALDTPSDPALKNRLLPRALCDLILRLLAKDPDVRPRAASSVAEELQRIIDALDSPESSATPLPLRKTKSVVDAPHPVIDRVDESLEWHAEPQPVKLEKKRIRWRLVAAAMLLVGVIASGVIIIIKTSNGTIEIETDDPNIKIAIHNKPELAPPPRLVNPKLAPPPRLVITRAITDTDRRAALQWVLDSGGWMDVGDNGGWKTLRGGDRAPDVPCTITRLSLEAVQTLDDTIGEKMRAIPEVKEVLILEGSSISDAGLAGLAACPGLKGIKSITLGRTTVTGEGLKHLAAFPELITLNLWATGIRADDLAALRSLKITNLHLGGSPQVGDDAMDHIAATGITKLDLAQTAVTDIGVKKLRPLTGLTDFSVTGPKITDGSVETLCSFAQLKVLVLNETRITDKGVIRFTAALPKLDTLVLRDTGVSNASMDAFANCTELTHLVLNSTQVTDAGLEKLKGKMPKLGLLGLGDNGERITDAGMKHLAGIPKLKSLHVNGTSVTFTGLTDLSDQLPGCSIYWGGGVLKK